MKLSKLVGDRFKERPSECAVESHALMVRGGYIKQVAGGIFSLYPPLKRVVQKIERIIREEMDAIDGQEVLFPVVLPGSLWEESGRYQSVGSELARFKDRNDTPMVLGMTHEEASVHLVREFGQTYSRYPFMIYQIQTKFRDEPRPRAGLIRVREFTMKDAYSFHTSQEDLERYYDICLAAYERIFKRAGLKNCITVKSDSGMMGGKVAHEFMLLTPVGEDTLVICPECGYKANMEAAACSYDWVTMFSQVEQLTEVHTPGQKTIEEVTSFLSKTPEQACKAVVYRRNTDGSLVVLFLRGDLEANETKVANHLGCAIHPAELTENDPLVAGFVGPMGLDQHVTVLFDRSLEHTANLITGANRTDYHMTGFQIERDYGAVEYGDFAKITTGGICPQCGKHSITISRGIEVGNIFQLGKKYTESMGMQYTAADGLLETPVMGCYGIGVGRLAASVCEESRDEYGPIWPISIAPWQVHLCCMRPDDEENKTFADELYETLQKRGVEVLYDDRAVSAGVMFSDADLLGAPVRVVCSPRNRKEGVCELVTRDKAYSAKVPLEDIVTETEGLIKRLFDAL